MPARSPSPLHLIHSDIRHQPAETALPHRGVRIEGEGPAIVLLHSSTGSKSQWRTLMEQLRGDFRLIAIDLAGYGDNPMPLNKSTHALADEVALVRSRLASVLDLRERFHLVGHSFGGAVSLRLAHECPERVRSIALYEPTAFHLMERTDPVFQEIRDTAAAIELEMARGEMTRAATRFIDFWSAPGAFDAMPASRQVTLMPLMAKVPLDFQALFRDPLGPEDYSALSMPTCVIRGSRSPACARTVASILSRCLPANETHDIDAGHMAPLTHADQVNAIIDRFIRRTEAAAATAADVSRRRTSGSRR